MRILSSKIISFTKKNIAFLLVAQFTVYYCISKHFFVQTAIKHFHNINVILIVIDSLRADHLNCYGYLRNTSTYIDMLSQDGVKFTQAIAPAGWTSESVPSILTGTYPPTHQINDWGDLRNPSITTLAQYLAERGYQCILWSNWDPIADLDIKDGFQKEYILHEFSDEALTDRIINQSKLQNRNSPFFFYIHYKGCHFPYRPPSPYKYIYMSDDFYNKKQEFIPIAKNYDGQDLGDVIANPNYYISQYDGSILYIDTQIGRLLYHLKNIGLYENTLIILTADHGEMLGEHSLYFRHTTCYEENIKVPLIIKFPHSFVKRKTVSKQISLIDIAPTILEMLKIKKPAYMQGESLMAFIMPWRIYHTNKVLTFNLAVASNALRCRNWKIYYNGGSWSLYNLNRDPEEQHNLVYRNSIKFEGLRKVLEDYKIKITSENEAKKGYSLSDDKKMHLKNFGYMQ